MILSQATGSHGVTIGTMGSEPGAAGADLSEQQALDNLGWDLLPTPTAVGSMGVTALKVLATTAFGKWLVAKFATRGLPNSAVVARGGNAANQTAAKLEAAIGPSRTPGVNGFSAQYNGGTCLSELGQFIPNKQMGITTVGEIRGLGGDVIVTPGFGHHVTVTGISGEAASPLLQIVPNPNPLVRP